MTALAADFPNALPDLRWPAGARNALALCAIGSLALHLAFAIVARPAADGAPRQAATAVGSSNTVQLRLIAPSPAPAPPVAAPTASDPALAPLQKAEAPTRPVAKATPLSHPAIEAPRAATEASAPTVDRTALPADTSTPPPIIDPANPTGFDDYIPRPLLSVGPAATAPVLIDTPIGNFGVARHVGILSLFIDEEGAVQHVAGSEPLLPALLEQAAREAFMAARFTPGEVDGRPVKSRIRVEVVFDNTPLK